MPSWEKALILWLLGVPFTLARRPLVLRCPPISRRVEGLIPDSGGGVCMIVEIALCVGAVALAVLVGSLVPLLIQLRNRWRNQNTYWSA